MVEVWRNEKARPMGSQARRARGTISTLAVLVAAAMVALVLTTSMSDGADGTPAKSAAARPGPGTQAVAPRAAGSAPKVEYGSPRTLLSGPLAPGAIAIDAVGDVYIDYGGQGQVVKIAQGQTQAVPVATVASPLGYLGIAVDGAGDLFQTSNEGNKVLEQAPGGTITTLPFTGLVRPIGVAVDGAGDVFVTSTTQVVELPKGGAQIVLPFSGLEDAQDLAVDGAGDVYVTDLEPNRVLELPAGGSQITVALQGPLDPSALAVDAAGNLFVADSTLGVLELSKGGVQTVLPFPDLPGAGGVAVDGDGDVFVSYQSRNLVAELPAGSSAVVPFPANATAQPGGLAVDRAGDVFVSDSDDNLVLEVPPGGAVTKLAFTGLNGPTAVAVDGSGDVFVVDTGNNRVVELSPGGTQVTLPIQGLDVPTGLALDGAGDVFVTSGFTPDLIPVLGANPVTTHSATPNSTPAVIELPVGGTQKTLPFTSLANPASVAVDAHGNVYVADSGLNVIHIGYVDPVQVLELRPDDSQVTVSSAFEGPEAVAVDRAGDVFMDQTFQGNPTGGAVVELPYGARGSATIGATNTEILLPIEMTPAELAVDGSGNLFDIAGGDLNEVDELPIDQALFTNPVNGQLNVTTTTPFTWSTIPAAQGYDLIVGTTLYGKDLVNSGVLAPSQSSFAMPALPPGQVLYATLFTEENSTWARYQTVGFTAASTRMAAFTEPVNGQANVDTTKAFTWTKPPDAQGYILVVGTKMFATNLVNSGPLAATQTSFVVPALPGGPLFATLLTEVNGAYSQYQAVGFTAASGGAAFTGPTQGQLDVATPGSFSWSRVAGAQGYDFTVGTTVNGDDLVASPVLSPLVSNYAVPSLPSGKTLYATIYTEIGGVWVNDDAIRFTAAT